MSYFLIHKTTAAAALPYNPKSLISLNENGLTVHLTGLDDIRDCQKAARLASGLLHSQIEFVGQWDPVLQRSFVLALGNTNLSVKWAQADTATMQTQSSTLNQALMAVEFARELVNQSPQDLSPESLAEQVAHHLEGLAPEYVSAKHIVGDALVEFGWHGLYEVGRGSERPPVLLELDYNPTGNPDAPVDVALVGKGITFDSGGYSIKSSEGMLDMKCDMGGAATVSAALSLAIMEGSTKRIRLLLCCAENLISGHAYKLGDIITYKNGLTVEIVNTDAEGRLVLADGLMAASEAQPGLIIDAATLTGAAVMAVGTEYNALFSTNNELAQQLIAIGAAQAEPFWQLPLAPWHQEMCPSPFADTANSRPQKGGGAGGASNAAGFLARFVDANIPWIHIDLAGAYHRNPTNTKPAGATGMGVLSIAQLLK